MFQISILYLTNYTASKAKLESDIRYIDKDIDQLEEKQEGNRKFLVEVDFFKGSILKLISQKITFHN